jgi:hypothetical protein
MEANLYHVEVRVRRVLNEQGGKSETLAHSDIMLHAEAPINAARKFAEALCSGWLIYGEGKLELKGK